MHQNKHAHRVGIIFVKLTNRIEGEKRQIRVLTVFKVRDIFTFAAFLVDQVKASRTQTLVADLKVIANMGAASIVILALVGA